MQPNHLVGLARWLCVRLGTKWLWVRILLQSENQLLYVNLFSPPRKFIMKMLTAEYNIAFRVHIPFLQVNYRCNG